MNISSLNLFGTNYSTWLTNLSQGSRLIGSTQNGGNSGTFANRLNSADGDTFQMSSMAKMMGGRPPMMGGMPPQQAGNGIDLGSFLEKVKNGTITDEDLENLKTQLTEAADQTDSTTGSGESSEATDLRDSIKTLLDKVKDGTVTEEDLSEMKDQLANAQASAGLAGMPPMGGPPPMGGGPPPSDENSEAIGSFLDKVKAGTVTESDLADLQELLTSTEEEADSTEETSSTSRSSSFKDTIEGFLDKVKAGTVTEEDLTEMQEQLASLQAPAGMPPMGGPPPMGGGPPPSDENSEAIGSLLDKVKAGTVTESDLTDLQELLASMQEEDDSTEETTSTGKASSFKDTIGSFLDKVKAGTVTEDDLTALKDTLGEMPTMPSSAFTGGLEDFLKYLDSESSTGSKNRSYTTEQLRQALKAYQNSGYQENFSDYWQYYA